MRRPRAKRGVSAQTLWLLEQVERDRGSLLRRAAVPELIARVADRSEPVSILYLRELLFDRGSTRRAALQAMTTLTGCVTPHDWVWFDDQMRRGWLGSTPLYGGPWNSMEPIRFGRIIDRLDDRRPAVLQGIAHGNGFVREFAIESAVSSRITEALPLVLLRLRDWVPEVRAAARRAWIALLPETSDDELLAMVPLLGHLTELDPTPEFRAGAEEIRARLTEDSGRVAISGLASDEVVTRRHCFGVAAATGAMSPEALFEKAIDDPDPRIQSWSVELAQQATHPADRLSFLRAAARVPRSRVRLSALRALWATEPEQALDVIEDALLAPAASIRDFALWALRQGDSFDAATYYRDAVRSATGRELASALLELGRWGSPEDAPLAAGFLSAEHGPRARSAALRAVYHLDPIAARPYYESGLLAESRRVARVARDLLLLDFGYPVCENAQSWARDAPLEHSRAYALTVAIRRCPKWKRLITLLETLLEGEEPLTTSAKAGLTEWMSRSRANPVAPTPEERERVRWLVARCDDLLPQRAAEEIEFAAR